MVIIVFAELRGEFGVRNKKVFKSYIPTLVDFKLNPSESGWYQGLNFDKMSHG